MIHVVARFITHGPDDHAWMILVTLHHAFGTFHERRFPSRVGGELMEGAFRPVLGTPHAMSLQIRLVNHIEADLITKLQKARIIRVVRGPNRVHIVLLH
ncbi:hypothetical protein D3C73_1527020 [compost metagenome]